MKREMALSQKEFELKVLELEEKNMELQELQILSQSKFSQKAPVDHKTILNTVHEESKENLLDAHNEDNTYVTQQVHQDDAIKIQDSPIERKKSTEKKPSNQ